MTTVRVDSTGIPKEVLDGKFLGKRPVGRPRLRREDKIRRDCWLLLMETRREERYLEAN